MAKLAFIYAIRTELEKCGYPAFLDACLFVTKVLADEMVAQGLELPDRFDEIYEFIRILPENSSVTDARTHEIAYGIDGSYGQKHPFRFFGHMLTDLQLTTRTDKSLKADVLVGFVGSASFLANAIRGRVNNHMEGYAIVENMIFDYLAGSS